MRRGVLSTNSHLDEADAAFLNAFRKNCEDKSKSGKEQLLKDFPRLFKSAVEEFGEAMFGDLLKNSEEMVCEERHLHQSFNERNEARWNLTFRYLRAIYKISSEVAPMTIAGLNTQPEYQNCPKLHSLITLHARSLRVTAEIICLMENGFADGALARWRSLHELNVIAVFLSAEDRIIAERYLASRDIEAYKAAIQYKNYEDRANLIPFDAAEIEQLRIRRDQAVTRYSLNPKFGWGWAAEPLRKANPDFSMIEQHVGLDHWRPRVRWASQEIHGAFVPNGVGLGVSENQSEVHLIGASNSGMSDPAQMAAISLSQITTALLSLEATLDRLAAIHAIQLFIDEIGKVVIVESGKQE